MCTAITYSGYNTYFGRNLDLEHLYDEAVTVVPRKFPLRFKREETMLIFTRSQILMVRIGK